MKVRIHYTIKNVEDSIDLSGETVEDVTKQVEVVMKQRNLEVEKNNCWSEEI